MHANALSRVSQSLTGVFMSTVAMQAGERLAVSGLQGRNVLLYVVRGRIEVASHGDLVNAYQLVELDEDGDALLLRAVASSLPCSVTPTRSASRWWRTAPFVMNTREEIAQAIADYQAGRFGSMLA